MEKTLLTLVSWNVNGLRALMQKDFPGSIHRLDADILAVQETKLQEPQLQPAISHLPGYTSHWSHCEAKKGYSGVGAYSRLPPQAVACGIGQPRFDCEGRILELDYGSFLLLNVYFPNGGMSEQRLQYKLDFYEAFFAYTDAQRERGRSLVICGDYNTAHREIDLARPRANQNTSGFLKVERDWLDRIVARGYVDTYRHFHPDQVAYSWWDYRFRARERNVGWRIDYVFVTRDLIERGCVRRAFIAADVHGSDHCPVGVVLEI
jgi:exodeoxyribonuclease III